VYYTAAEMDRTRTGKNEGTPRKASERAELLTPIVKAYATDMGVDMSSLAIQVLGGLGYIEEAGAAQHFRDARIAPIYEGTNEIQALDFVGRKLPLDGGAHWQGCSRQGGSGGRSHALLANVGSSRLGISARETSRDRCTGAREL
jgi:hypothetical protein